MNFHVYNVRVGISYFLLKMFWSKTAMPPQLFMLDSSERGARGEVCYYSWCGYCVNIYSCSSSYYKEVFCLSMTCKSVIFIRSCIWILKSEKWYMYQFTYVLFDSFLQKLKQITWFFSCFTCTKLDGALSLDGLAKGKQWRCHRTDGKKWRCSRKVVLGKNYCERHVKRNKNLFKRSRFWKAKIVPMFSIDQLLRRWHWWLPPHQHRQCPAAARVQSLDATKQYWWGCMQPSAANPCSHTVMSR